MTEEQSAINLEQNETIRIPKEWKEVKLQEVLTLLRNGLVKKQNKDGKGYPITRIETISDEKIDITKVGYIEHITQNEIDLYKLTEGDILFSHINSLVHIGKTAIYDGKPSALLHGMNLLILRSNKSFVFPMFLLYQLRYLRMKDLFRNIAKKAVNQASINQTELGKVGIPLPPLPEQRKIAEILGTVDKAIEKVEQAIEKADRLKKGLMQELLTKGIGHKEFKESEIGRIPKEWEVVKLGDKDVSNLIMGQSPPSSTYNKKGEGLPFLQGKAEFGEIHPTPLLYCSRPIKIAEKNDVLLSVRAPVGDVNIASLKSCIGRGLTTIRPKNNRLYYLYLFYYLIFKKRIFKSLSTGSTFKAIRRSEIENYLIPLPSLPEQQKIAEILDTVDKRRELLKVKKQIFERVKRELMNDLLTGRKRVKV